MLDKDGKPTQGVVNQCHAPIMLDENNRICYQPSYYILKQISRTVQPGTVSIKPTTDADIAKTAVIDEAGNISVMLGNVTDAAQTVCVVDQDRAVSVTFQPHSLTTVTFRDDYRPGNGINPDLSEELGKPIHAVASTLKNPVFTIGQNPPRMTIPEPDGPATGPMRSASPSSCCRDPMCPAWN